MLLFLLVLLIPLLAFLVFVLYLHQKHKRYRHLPGPERSSFFKGNISEIRQRREQQRITIHQLWIEYGARYSPLFVFWFFHRPVVIITDPKLVKEVLITTKLPKDPFGYSHFASLFGERLLGRGLLSEVSEKSWAMKRGVLDPAFRRSNLMKLIDSFNSSTDIFLRKLASMAERKMEFSLAEELVRLTLDIIAKVAFDLDVNAIHSANAPIPENTRTVLEGLVQSFRKPFLKFQPSTFPYQRKCKKAVRFLRSAAREVIQARIAAVNKGEDEHDDILSHILQIAQRDENTTLEDLVDHFLTFVVGGQETTSDGITFTLMGIVSNPEVEERVISEIDDVLGSRPSVEYEDLGKLTYLDQVMKEALRLHPPQPAITRVTTEETRLGDYVIPAKTSVMVDAYVLHHHPAYWHDPEKFDPGRFEPTNRERLNHYAYFPFSLGPHNCIGLYMAQFETKLVIARVLQTFKIHLAPGQNLKAMEHITFRPKDGLRCTLSLR